MAAAMSATQNATANKDEARSHQMLPYFNRRLAVN